jgi:hypothetical protein
VFILKITSHIMHRVLICNANIQFQCQHPVSAGVRSYECTTDTCIGAPQEGTPVSCWYRHRRPSLWQEQPIASPMYPYGTGTGIRSCGIRDVLALCIEGMGDHRGVYT